MLLPTVPAEANDDATPAPQQSRMFSKQQLALVAASISRLPRQSQQGTLMQSLPGSDQQQRASHGSHAGQAQLEQLEQAAWQQQEPEQLKQRRNRRRSKRASDDSLEPAMQAEARPQGRQAVGSSQRLSGFTVYTNDLRSSAVTAHDQRDVAAQPGQQAAEPGSPASRLDSQGSGITWRSISSAAMSRREEGSGAEEGGDAVQQQRRRQHNGHKQAAAGPAVPSRQQSVDSRDGSKASSHQLRGSRGSLEAGMAPPPDAENWAGNKLLHRAHQLPKLMVPGLDSSQVRP
jgi:hypothetical protein